MKKDNEFTSALKEFQRFFHLNQTGIIDQPTLELMEKPRCAVPDKTKSASTLQLSFTKSGRSKRSAAVVNRRRKIGVHQNRFYFIIRTMHPSYDYETMYNAFEYAFNLWAGVTNLEFVRGDALGYTDIMIGFYSGTL